MASTYTLSSISAAILDRLDDNSIFFTSTEVTAVANEAVRCVNNACGFYQGTVSLVSQANQPVYSTPAGMLYPLRVQYEGFSLDPEPISRIGQDYPTWATDTTAKLGFVARWIPIGINYFCLHPIDSIGGGNVQVTGVLDPPLMVNPSDPMVLDDEYANLVVEYGAHRLPLKQTGKITAEALRLYQKSFLPTLKKLTNLRQLKMPQFFIKEGAPTTEGRLS